MKSRLIHAGACRGTEIVARQIPGSWYDTPMNGEDIYDHFLIREATVLVRVPRETGDEREKREVEFFDVRSGVRIRELHPAFRNAELDRAHLLSPGHGAAIIKSGTTMLLPPWVDLSKVVSILDIKQRKLDTVVADSIIDQTRVVRDLLQGFLNVAATAENEERFWLSQQILPLLTKFSGRELAELEEIVEWFKSRPRKG